MKIYFDTEFTGLTKNTTLISIGLVDETGKSFYGELTSFNRSMCDDWIRKNVLANLTYGRSLKDKMLEHQVYGSKALVGEVLKEWLSKYDEIQFVSDVSHYDFVLLIDLLTNGGSAFDLPSNINPSCHDINQDIATHYKISEKEAFDKSREDIVQELCSADIDGVKHNALYDARVIKAIYENLSLREG